QAGYQPNQGYQSNRQAGYQSNQGYQQAGYQPNQGYQSNRQAGYQSNQGYQQAGYQPNQGYQPNRQAGYQSNQGYQSNRQAGYQSNQGYQQNNGMYQNQAAQTVPKKSKTPLIVGITAGVVVIAAAVVLILFMTRNKFDKDGYKALLDEYFAAYADQDTEATKSFYPENIGEKAWESTLDTVGYDSVDEYWEGILNYYGEPFTVSYTIDDSEEVEKNEISDFEKAYNTYYEVDLSFDYLLKVDLTETYKGNLNSYTGEETMYVGVIDGKWYMLGQFIYLH
ncbi:MAG: hypothetical protein ACI4EF_00650, partial [Coprococcus sp.]